MDPEVNGKGYNFTELCRQFSSVYQRCRFRRCTGRVLYQTEWTIGCLNDTLNRYLQEKNFPYLRTLSGDIWFLDDTETWTTVEYIVQGSTVTAYEIKLQDNNRVCS